MSSVIVQYSIKPEHVAENERLIAAVYDELNTTKPNGIHYSAFLLEDGVTFVHVGRFEDEAAREVHLNTVAFRTFQQDIDTRFATKPTFTEARKIGSYQSAAE